VQKFRKFAIQASIELCIGEEDGPRLFKHMRTVAIVPTIVTSATTILTTMPADSSFVNSGLWESFPSAAIEPELMMLDSVACAECITLLELCDLYTGTSDVDWVGRYDVMKDVCTEVSGHSVVVMITTSAELMTDRHSNAKTSKIRVLWGLGLAVLDGTELFVLIVSFTVVVAVTVDVGLLSVVVVGAEGVIVMLCD